MKYKPPSIAPLRVKIGSLLPTAIEVDDKSISVKKIFHSTHTSSLIEINYYTVLNRKIMLWVRDRFLKLARVRDSSELEQWLAKHYDYRDATLEDDLELEKQIIIDCNNMISEIINEKSKLKITAKHMEYGFILKVSEGQIPTLISQKLNDFAYKSKFVRRLALISCPYYDRNLMRHQIPIKMSQIEYTISTEVEIERDSAFMVEPKLVSLSFQLFPKS